MGWGRLKPFWQSKAWKESAQKGTGIFSWGDSDLAKTIDLKAPGLGTALDSWLDNLAKVGKGGAFEEQKSGVTAQDAINTASFASNNQIALYGLIGLVAYKVFFK